MLDLGDNFPLCYYAGGKYVAGEIAESESLLTSRGLTSGKRHRLTQQSDALHQEWDIRSEKVKRMRSALVIESAVTIRFQLEQQLLEEEAQLAHLGSQIDEIEQALQ